MKPIYTTVMGERYLLTSDRDASPLGLNCPTVILSPSVTQDFKIELSANTEGCVGNYHAAAISAAAFLIEKRGLPLDEIIFESPCCDITVSTQKSGHYSIKTNKCKFLFTKPVEIQGAEVDFSDILISGNLFRCIRCESLDFFDDRIARALTHAEKQIPSAVILLPLDNDISALKYYTGYTVPSPSALLCRVAGAYAAFVFSGHAIRNFSDAYGQYSVTEESITLKCGVLFD